MTLLSNPCRRCGVKVCYTVCGVKQSWLDLRASGRLEGNRYPGPWRTRKSIAF
jgi:hypothetical protein